MSEKIKKYHDLVAELNALHQLGGSDIEEDRLLDELDALWYRMSKEEKDGVEDSTHD